MWSIYRFTGHSAANFRPTGGTDGLNAPFARDIEDVLLELKQCGLGGLFKAWRARRHYRKELGRLLRVGRHMISDIGLTLAEAEAAADRPFWRA